jgi:hemerythrin
MNIKWDNSLVLGIQDIDDQHQHFLSLIDELYEKLLNKKTKSEVHDSLIQIYGDTLNHFKYEEEIFKCFNYSLALEHAQMHSYIIEKISFIMNEFEKKISDVLQISMAVEIKAILINHMKNHDTKFAVEMKNKNAFVAK